MDGPGLPYGRRNHTEYFELNQPQKTYPSVSVSQGWRTAEPAGNTDLAVRDTSAPGLKSRWHRPLRGGESIPSAQIDTNTFI
jgi:hypothetical protein